MKNIPQLASPRQQPHQPTMRFLTPRLQLDLTLGIVAGLLVVATPLV